MDDLIAFLRARLDEVLTNCPRNSWPDLCAYLDADVAAKREIIERHEMHAKELARLNERAVAGNLAEHKQAIRANLGIRLNESRVTLRLLALPYAGHEDYRAEWKS